MLRSHINEIVAEAIQFIDRFHFKLPPFAFWDIDTWQSYKNQPGRLDHIMRAGLGWDVTDHGLENFATSGIVLFTLRNGNPTASSGSGYAEKLIISQVDQKIPFHYHKIKTEDIINRGGGLFCIELYNSTPDGRLADTDCIAYIDGQAQNVKPGTILKLRPGSSIHLPPLLYHRFWAEDAPVLLGEVSTVNDDHGDNFFLEKIGRFPTIIEDEPIRHLLVGDYLNQLT